MISAAAVRDFQFTRVPPAFLDDPYPWYAALREQDPVHALEGGGVFLSRYEDAIAVYRDPHIRLDVLVQTTLDAVDMHVQLQLVGKGIQLAA